MPLAEIGTLSVWLRPHQAFPPSFSAPLYSKSEGGDTIELFVHRGGFLEFRTTRNDQVLASYVTQAVRVMGFTWLNFIAKWNEQVIDVWVNDSQLRAWDESNFEIHWVEGKYLFESNVASYAHPSAVDVCRDSMAWRALLAEASNRTVSGRRMLSIAEQVKQLEEAVAQLSDWVSSVGPGVTKPAIVAAAALRALVYWEERKKSYNPLLLRVAGIANLPLPVYAFMPLTFPPGFPRPMELYGSEATTERIAPGQELMDLQAWLQLPVVPHLTVVRNTSGPPGLEWP